MMWTRKQMVRVLARGGILTPSYMLNILHVVKASGNKYVHFGSRQDLLFQVGTSQMDAVKEAFGAIQTDYIAHGRKGPHAQNIVSSYPAADMAAATPWLSSGNYLNILERFSFQPTLRVNIADPRQSLVPLFYGNLNYIASSVKDYWHLYIRKDEKVLPERWPVLVLSDDIGSLSKNIEKNWHITRQGSIADLFELSQHELNYNWRKTETVFQLESIPPHDYEGFGKMHNTQGYWAGFYWRNNCYDIAFLEEVCHLSLRTNISKICLTPWKSFLVKDLQEKDLIQWQRLLGRFGINMRHSSFELNWHLPLQDKLALRLKRFIVKEFDKVDVCVHGLTFGIKTKPEPSFCAIQIERKPGIGFLKRYDPFANYKVSYAKHFNANLCEYEEYMPQVPRYRLPEVLQSLTLKFYAQLLKANEMHTNEPKAEKTMQHIVYQCRHCFSIYDDQTGDALQRALPGTPFAQLPTTYHCPLCDAPKTEFAPIDKYQLMKGANA